MENYVGEIRLFAGTFAPAGWLFCDGSSLAVSSYQELFALIGTTYGGDGVNAFNVPDLRGQLPIGQGNGGGLTPRTLGQTGGAETETLAPQEIPAHSHPVSVTSATATTISPGPSVVYGTVTPNGDTYSLYTSLMPPDVVPHQMSQNAVGPTGGNQPHDNTMLTTPINFIIATSGFYPTQS